MLSAGASSTVAAGLKPIAGAYTAAAGGGLPSAPAELRGYQPVPEGGCGGRGGEVPNRLSETGIELPTLLV